MPASGRLRSIRRRSGTRPVWRAFCSITVLIPEPDMRQNPPFHLRRARPRRPVDDTLRRVFAPILAEALPDRFRVILDALDRKGSVDDPANDRNDNRPR